ALRRRLSASKCAKHKRVLRRVLEKLGRAGVEHTPTAADEDLVAILENYPGHGPSADVDRPRVRKVVQHVTFLSTPYPSPFHSAAFRRELEGTIRSEADCQRCVSQVCGVATGRLDPSRRPFGACCPDDLRKGDGFVRLR